MFPPNINPQTYAFSAVIVASLLSKDFTIDEANTIGNWLVLAGDYLITCAGQGTLIQNRQIPNTAPANSNVDLDKIKDALNKMAKHLKDLNT